MSSAGDSYFMQRSVSVDELCRAVNAALRSRQWQDVFIDREGALITASLKHDQPIMNKSWHYRFTATIKWWLEGPDVGAMEVTVSECNYQWTQAHSRQFLDQLVMAVDEALGSAAFAGAASAGGSTRGARWAGVTELRACGYIGALQPGEFLIGLPPHLPADCDENNDACRDGAPAPSADIIKLTESDTNRHAIICGPTGSGKTSGVFIPNLIERSANCALVTEATGGKGMGDLFERTSGFRAANGHEIFYFNPDSPFSHRINPLDRVQSYRQARRVCEIIMQSTTLRTHRGDQSWELSEKTLLTALILHAAGERENGRCHLGYVNEMLNGGFASVKDAMSKTNVEQAEICFARFMRSTTDAYRNLVLNGVMNRLDAWNSPQISACTERTDMDWQALLKDLWTIYLAVPAGKAELKPLMSLVFNDLLEFVMTNIFEYAPMLMLDEFTNFGYVSGLPEKLTIIRHDGIPCVLGVQDFIQLELKYDREAKLLISQPGTRIFLKPNDLETAQKISTMLGEAISEQTKLSSGGHLQDKEKKEPLLSPDQLLNLQGNTTYGIGPQMIVMTPGVRPFVSNAFHYSDYAYFTDHENFPAPAIPALSAPSGLTPRTGTYSAYTSANPPGERSPKRSDFDPDVDGHSPGSTFDADSSAETSDQW